LTKEEILNKYDLFVGSQVSVWRTLPISANALLYFIYGKKRNFIRWKSFAKVFANTPATKALRFILALFALQVSTLDWVLLWCSVQLNILLDNFDNFDNFDNY
jgi:hypothetical protein